MDEKKGTKVFLDIDVGERGQYEDHLEAYRRGKEFCLKKGPTLGFATDFDVLNEEEKLILQEAYQADKNYSKNGTMALGPPEPICVGRIVIELYGDCPKTVENFKCLCTGEKGNSKLKKDKKLHYKGVPLHRLVPGLAIQGGDVTNGNGSGGESIYKGNTFGDEQPGLKRKFTEKGMLGMANSGRNTNTSQFFLTLGPCPKFDGKHVCFGKVVDGLQVLDKLNTIGATAEELPLIPITISNCGYYG